MRQANLGVGYLASSLLATSFDLASAVATGPAGYRQGKYLHRFGPPKPAERTQHFKPRARAYMRNRHFSRPTTGNKNAAFRQWLEDSANIGR